MYRIAYFTTDWNIDITKATIDGAVEFARERGDVKLYIFNCFGVVADTAKSLGEYSIFSLPDLSDFDAAFVHGNEIVNLGVLRRLGYALDRAGIPVISYEVPVGRAQVLRTDNRAAMYDMTSHVVTVHGARKLFFVRGIESFTEASEREAGFKQACRDLGIAESDVRYFNSDYLYQQAYREIGAYLDAGGKLPDAILCANDSAAMGAAQAVQNHGFLIPDDVIVTGFDNCFEATAYQPQITSVERDYSWASGTSLHNLLRRLEGQEAQVPESRYRLVCAGSCGCMGKLQPDRAILHRYAMSNQFIKDFYHRQGTILGELFEAKDLKDIMEIVEKNAPDLFDTQEYFLVLNRELTETGRRGEGYGEKLLVMASGAFGRRPDSRHVYAEVERHELVPAEMEENHSYFTFYPVHYGLDILGYFVFMAPSRILTLRLMESTISSISSSIENVLSKMELARANARLEYLYNHDPLTDLYNRFGMRSVGEPVYRRLCRSGGAQILFVDMDGMKKINDGFGHDAGDEAISRVAGVIREVCRDERDCFAMRFGGDEFIVISADGKEELADAILRGIERENREGDYPYQLSVSIGLEHAAAADADFLEEKINAADERMYERKKAKKAARE